MRRISISNTAISLFLTLSIAVVSNAAGIFDESFGSEGRLRPFSNNDVRAVRMETDGSGRMIVAATRSSGAGTQSIFIRLNPNGAADPSFGESGSICLQGALVNSFALAGDGSIVAVGSRILDDGSSDLLILRISPDGRLDDGFGEGGLVTADLAKSEALSGVAFSGGKIVAAGGFDDEGMSAVAVRLNSDGSFDQGFGDNGLATYRFPHTGSFEISIPADVEIVSGGTAYVGGDWEFELDGRRQMGSYIVPFSATGQAGDIQATPFVAKGSYSCDGSFDGAVLPDGSYVTVGRQGGIDRFHDGSRVRPISGARILVAGGCFGGGLKIYDGTDFHVIGVVRGIDILDAAPLNDGRIGVLSRDGEVRMLKGITSNGTRQADFDEDDRADFVVFRRSEGKIYINNGLGNSFVRTIPATTAKIIPEPALFDSSIDGIVRDKTAFWTLSDKGAPGGFALNSPAGSEYFSQSAGAPGDIPFAGDFDGDGAIDTGCFRPSEGMWYRKAHLAFTGFADPVQWGAPGDRPVPADYDGDGITDHAVFRPSDGTWWILGSKGNTQTGVQFGLEGDIPLTGDFDGDGKADLTVFRPSEGNWYQLLSREGFRALNFGIATDEPVPGDYDGDGRTDVAVYRQGTWFLLMSSRGFASFQWGQPGDVPVSARYDR